MRVLPAVCLLAVGAPASAEVLDASALGFTSHNSVQIAIPRAEVYSIFVRDVSRWWNPDHTVGADAANLSLDPRPMGCFCERLGENAGVVHMTVTFANPQVMLRLTGGLGPLGLMGVSGNMTVEFDDRPGAEGDPAATVVTLQYAVGGYHADGLDTLAPAVDGVLAEQLARLRDFAERQAGEAGSTPGDDDETAPQAE